MVRKIFKKKKKSSSKLDAFIDKYHIPREYLSTNRKSVCTALFIGIFIGLIPMPFQMLLVLAMIPFFKFNVPLAISMVWLSNPLTMPFMYYLEYKTGAFLLGMSPLHVELTMEWFHQHLGEIFIPLYTGTLFYSLTLSPSVYFIVNWLWIHSVKQEQRKKPSSPL
jgi:uncharacterized protein